MRLNLGRCNRIASRCCKPRTKRHEDAEAIDGALRCLRVNEGVHEGPADCHKEEAGHIPWLVVAKARHEEAVEHDGKDSNADEGQKRDGRLHAGVAEDEAEVERDVVDWNEQRRAETAHGHVQNDQRPALQEVSGEKSVRFCRKKREVLCDNEGNQSDKEDHIERDDAAVRPRPGGTAQGERHTVEYVDSSIEKNAEPVHVAETLLEGLVGLRKVGFKDEDDDGRTESE